MTFDQSTNDSNVQVLAINIWDDQLVEGTENFVISGSVTPPASFVSGRGTVTVDILDNDGKLELFYTQSWCLNHNCRKLHPSLKHLRSLVTSAINTHRHIGLRRQSAVKIQLENIPVMLFLNL